MQSKRSFFNKTLFKKHLSRFWPLWGGVSLVGAMFPLYQFLALMQNYAGGYNDSGTFRYMLYEVAVTLAPGLTCCYAVLCVTAVWGYLYNVRSVGLFHTLPVDRTCLFVTNTLAALAMELIPFAVVGGLTCLNALLWGYFDLVGVVNTVLAVLFCTVLFTGMAALCAMLTGHTFVLPVFYLLGNFLAFMMEMLVTNLAHEFLVGVPMLEDLGRLNFLSPIVKLYNSSFTVAAEHLTEDVVVYHLKGLWVVALYALAGLGLLALSWFLYRKRHSECAGDVVAFRWLQPVFRYGAALLSGLTIGRLLYELMWRTLFQRRDYADALPMTVCLFLGGLLGYYAASMLLAKSRRVFGKKSLPGVGIVAAGAIAVCLLASVDLFGLERKVPQWDEIESVTIMDRGIESGPWSAESDPEQAEALWAFHQAIVDDRDYVRSYVPDWRVAENKVFSHHIYVTYRLKDGSSLRREYDLWMAADRMEAAGTYENLLSSFYQDPKVRAGDVLIPEGAGLNAIEICCSYADNFYTDTIDHADGDDRETRQIYAALQKDAEEGNIPPKNVLAYHSDWFSNDFYLYLNYRILRPENNGYFGQSKEVYLAPSMTNTINTLVELGYVTEAGVAEWVKDLEDAREEAAREAAAWEENLVPAAEYAVPAA